MKWYSAPHLFDNHYHSMDSQHDKGASPSSDALLTAAEVAAKLNIAKTAVYAMVSRGEISHYRIGRLVRIHQDDVDAFLGIRHTERADFDSSSKFSYVRYPQA